MKDRLGYVEWMQKINSVHQSPSQIAKGIERLVLSAPSEIPPGVVRRHIG